MKCFKCEKEMESSYGGDDGWEAPSGGVQFEGGWNFGSAIYDAMMDNIHVEVIVCDDCLKAAKGTDRLREMKKIYTPTRSERVETLDLKDIIKKTDAAIEKIEDMQKVSQEVMQKEITI